MHFSLVVALLVSPRLQSVFAQPPDPIVELLVELRPNDAAPEMQFGESVDNDDGVIVGGAWMATVVDDGGSSFLGAGVLYVFEGDVEGVVQTGKLKPSDPVENGNLGWDVSTHNGVVVGGALNAPNGDIFPGAAYVFEKEDDEWPEYETAKLVAPAADAQDMALFGADVHAFEDVIVVGAYNQSDGRGSAYIFMRDENEQWAYHQTLEPTDNPHTSKSQYGRSLTVFKDTIIIGAYKENIPDVNEPDDALWTRNGAAYVYMLNDETGMWDFSQKILPSDPEDDLRFGLFMDEYEGELSVGSVWGTQDGVARAGRVYIFTRNDNDEWIETQIITSSEADTDDRFGRTQSIYDDVMVIGSHKDPDSDVLDVGNAFVFERQEDDIWVEKLVIGNPYPDTQSWFGRDVHIWKNLIGIGTPRDSQAGDLSGAVFLYHFCSCHDKECGDDDCDRSCGACGEGLHCSGHDCEPVVLEVELRPDDAAEGQEFGESVDNNAGVIVGGAWRSSVVDGDGNTIIDAGVLYIFEETDNGITQTARLEASDPVNNARFGRDVSTHNSIVVGGALNAPNGDIHPGAVYVFEKVNAEWAQTAKLVAPDGEDMAQFGSDVHVFGDIIVAGAYNQAGGRGSAYIYLKSDDGSWGHHQTLEPETNEYTASSQYGRSLAIFGDQIVVGAYKEDIPDDSDDGVAVESGAAYVYMVNPDTGKWDFHQKLLPSTTEDGYRFGLFMDEFRGEMSIGSVRATADGVEDTGVVYIFYKDEATNEWNENQVVISSDIDPGDRFGRTQSIYGNVMVVGGHGSPSDELDEEFVGSVFLFERQDDESWEEVAHIESPHPDMVSWFGRDVHIWETTISIGAPLDSQFYPAAGAVYIYRYLGDLNDDVDNDADGMDGGEGESDGDQDGDDGDGGDDGDDEVEGEVSRSSRNMSAVFLVLISITYLHLMYY